MHLWTHLQGGEAMGRCPFPATRPGGCRSGDHIHEAVTAAPRTGPKGSPQGHRLLPHQQRTDALRPVSEPRSLRRLGSGRSRLQDYHRATTEAVGNALDSRPRERNYRPSLFPAQWPLGRILGTTRRWLKSGRFFTYKFGAHPPGSILSMEHRECDKMWVGLIGDRHVVSEQASQIRQLVTGTESVFD